MGKDFSKLPSPQTIAAYEAISENDALNTKVKYRKKKRSLQWIGQHRPDHLEYLMSSLSPATSLFWAVSRVYQLYEKKLRDTTNTPPVSEQYIDPATLGPGQPAPD